jgi:hypothetical protein
MRKLVLLGVAAALALPGPAWPARSPDDLRAALAAWAAGDEAEALAILRTVDEQAAGRGATGLRRSKLMLARGLARQSPLAVLAFARLEERAYLVYAAERRSALTVASRALMPELLSLAASTRPRLFLNERSRPLAPAQAAMVLTSFGGHLHRAHQEAGAAVIYHHALQLDRQPAALLGLAALHEQRGEYAPAAELFGELVRLDGNHREGRLRYALNLERIDRAGQAEALLRELATTGTDWVRSLAAQELARLLAGRGEGGEAHRLLVAAVDALPCDPVLPVQAALVGERHGVALPLDLATLADCGEAGESARARYARPPASDLQALRQRLAAADGEWRDALRRALGRGR